MYVSSPMSNFNRKNPLIILLKKRYDEVTEQIQSFARSFVKLSVLTACTILCYIVTAIFARILVSFVIIPIFIMFILIFQGVNYIYRLKYYMKSSPAIVEFERLSNLQMNEILLLNNENIMNCLYSMNTMYGEMTTEFKYKKIMIVITDTVIVILSITAAYYCTALQ